VVAVEYQAWGLGIRLNDHHVTSRVPVCWV
jgi:hypothetical protein